MRSTLLAAACVSFVTAYGRLLLRPASPVRAPALLPCVPLQCMTTTKVQTESKAITGTAAVLPAGCKEVDTEFKCIRCANVRRDGGAANACHATLMHPRASWMASCN